jgi:tRNA modification GTPase
MEAGRLDLAQVEGLADLVEAETEAQRRQAMRVFSGELGDRVAGWRRDMIRAMALVEATIDFADEEVPVDVSPEVSGIIARLKNDLGLELAGFGAAERVRTGFEVAIVGPPNAGKSTLLNRLVGRKAALTSERAGTTRDVIEVRMDIGGLPVTLIDTAGLRDAEDDVERAGIAWGVERAEAADLRVHLILGDGRPEMPVAPDDLVVLAKDDDGSATSLSVSGTTGYGIEPLLGSIQEVISRRASGAGVAVRARHRAALQQGIGFLEDADRELALGSSETELLAESLRLGVRAIDSLVGRVDVEDVLGEIFASFCIGK